MIKRLSSAISLQLAGVMAATIASSCLWSSEPVLAQTIGSPSTTSGSITTIGLPRVDDYWFSATRQLNGAIILDGYAPDEATRKILAAHPKADAHWLQLGGGSPRYYRSAVDFGLAIIDRLSEGRFALRDNVVTLTGTAASQADYLAINKTLAAGVPSGLVLARAELLAPKVSAFQWSALKSYSGVVTLEGMVPDTETRAALLRSANVASAEELIFASGGPDNFLGSAQLGLELLDRVQEGQITFDGSGWILTGAVGSADDKAALEAQFTARNLAAAGWSMAISQAPQAASAAPAAVDPTYAFSAVKAVDGEIIFSGQVPADPAIRFFKAITSGNSDAVSIAPNAPPDFIMLAEAGVRALMQLEEGSLSFAEGRWTLSGVVASSEVRDAIDAALKTSSATAWTTELTLLAQSEPAQQQIVSTSSLQTTSVSGRTVEDQAIECISPLAEFSARNEILFRSGAAIIAPESGSALDELAADLAACPDVNVQVEGHTDADGDDQLNLALSVARAEAVIGALLERGISASRLYALGFGETQPISDNDTPEGKSLNRRIVVKAMPAQ